LYLNNCKLNDLDAVNLFDALFNSSNKKIMRIFLNQNELTNITAIKIAEVLTESNTKIREIGLKWNKI
jgi:hypothetical protein